MLSLILSALLTFTGTASAQQTGSELQTTFGGLDDTNAPDTLEPHKAQDALNVEVNQLGTSIGSRQGYALQLPLSLSTAPVTGSYSFIDPNGSRQDIVCYDRFCAKSTNQTAFVVFLTSGGRSGAGGAIPSFWTFTQNQGTMYMANSTRDTIESYDGTTLTSWPLIPKGSQVELASSRLVIADVVASPNSVYYSQSGVYTNFVAGVNSVDPYVDNIGSPGDRTTAMRYDRGKMWIWKSNSITACLVSDQYTSSCRILSPDIGTLDPLSIVSVSDGLYFRDQNRNFWRINENGLTPISLGIKNLVASQASGSGRSNTQTTQADWQAGVQYPTGTWNTTTSPGSIYNSSNTFTDDTSIDFGSGTLVNTSTTASAGSVTLAISSGLISEGDFQSSATWTCNNGGVPSAQAYISTSSLWANSGSSIAIITTPGFACNPAIDVMGVWYSTAGATTRTLGCGLNEITSGAGSISSNAVCSIPVLVSTPILITFGSNHFTNSQNIICSSTITALGYNLIFDYQSFCAGSIHTLYMDNIRVSSYPATGSFTSRAFDTTFTTAILSNFSPSLSSTPIAGITFQEQDSADGSSWGTAVSLTTGVAPSKTRRFWRHIDNFTTTSGTRTATMQSLTEVATTTGTFRTACISPGNSISSWGALACTESNTGNASIVYYATSAANCSSLPATAPNTWQTSISNNATISISTNAAMYIGWKDLVTSATETAQVDACTLYWNNGVIAPPVWGVFDSNQNAIFWTTTVGTNTTTNNRLLKYDLNRFEWFPFDIPANAPRYIDSKLFFGSPTSGNWYLYGNGVRSDDGNSFTSRWRSKDYSAGHPFNQKIWNTASWVGRNQQLGSVTTTWRLGNGKTGNYDVSLATDSTKPYIRSNVVLPQSSKTSFMSIQFGNSALNQPWEINGFRLDYTLDPWDVLTP